MKFPLLVLSLLVLLPLQGKRTGTVSGMVVDSKTKEPLPQTTIFDRGTRVGTQTDSYGRFSLSVLPGERILEIWHEQYPTVLYHVTVPADSSVVLPTISLPMLSLPKIPTWKPDSSVDFKMRFINPEELRKAQKDTAKVKT